MNYEWALIRCLGEGNLMQATEDYESRGWEIFTMMFIGLEQVEQVKGVISINAPNEAHVAARYLLITRRLSDAIQN